jgi:hypothetical protein
MVVKGVVISTTGGFMLLLWKIALALGFVAFVLWQVFRFLRQDKQS